MQREIDSYREKNFTGKEARLFKEWELIDQRCENDERVKYIIRKRNVEGLPMAYDIIFNIKSIIGVEEPDAQGLQRPIFGNKHIMRITLPNNYPEIDGCPKFNFISDVWHPNVRYHGEYKGRISSLLGLNMENITNYLVDYIDVIISWLTYEMYLAKNEWPYPLDYEVARWIIEQAEPQGWIPFEQEEKR